MKVNKTSKCWVFRFENYVTKTKNNNEIWGSANVYYKKSDIAKTLSFHSKNTYTVDNLPAPDSRWSDDCIVSDVIAHLVEPYRVVR